MKQPLALMTILLLISCSQNATQTNPKIVVSFYPLYDFTSKIVGDPSQVVVLIPPGVEPHDWEPTPKDIAMIQNSRALILNGAGMEAWAPKIIESAHPAKVIISSRGFYLLNSSDTSGPLDPHVWLDPILAQRQANAILAGLAEAAPENKAVYEANAQKLIEKFQKLDSDYKIGLAHCEQKALFTSHSAFMYLTNRYGLTQVSISGLSPDAEPTPARMAELVSLAKQKNVKYIFFETLASPKLAETLAREIGARSLVLNPIEGLTEEEQHAGDDYFTLMGENLNNLRTALNCT